MSSRKSSRNPGTIISPANDSEQPDETLQYITTSQLETILTDNRNEFTKLIKDTIQHELSSMKQEIVRLQSELDTVSDVANNAMKLSEQLQKDVTKLQEENTHLKTKIQNTINGQHKLEEVIEDNKNRQLRKTLVFKGIPEQQINEASSNGDGSQKTRSENWDDTATILANTMAETLNTSVDEARNMVERCHRAAANPKYKGNAPRPIFAAFMDWRDSELTKDSFRKNNADVFVEQKVGPRTTARRNMALKERKRLKDNNTIFNGYISHPARLMVKDTNARGAKYTMWKDYSNEPVNFDR